MHGGKTEEVLTEEWEEKIDAILAEYTYQRTHLVAILLAVQAAVPRHYISETVAYYLAEKLNLRISEIYDCITFYAAIHDQPRAACPLELCHSIVCRVNESDNLLAELKSQLGVELGEVTADGRFVIEAVSCFGACDQAPALRVNGRVYGNLDSREKIAALLNSLSAEVLG